MKTSPTLASGTGDFNLSDRPKLAFGAAGSSGEITTFSSGVDHLILGEPSSFDGTINDFFLVGDCVIANGFTDAQTPLYTQTGADSCPWTLTDGTRTATFNFAGEPYALRELSIVSANGGAGRAIKFI